MDYSNTTTSGGYAHLTYNKRIVYIYVTCETINNLGTFWNYGIVMHILFVLLGPFWTDNINIVNWIFSLKYVSTKLACVEGNLVLAFCLLPFSLFLLRPKLCSPILPFLPSQFVGYSIPTPTTSYDKEQVRLLINTEWSKK